MILPAAEGDLKAEKQALRRSMSERRQALSAREVRRASEAICARALALIAQRDVRTVALYAAIRNEVALGSLDAALRARGVAIAYPRVASATEIRFHLVAGPAELAPAGRYLIPEPPPTAPLAEPAALDVIMVPALAFDRRGYRLGWGAGYYDALLAQAPRALRIGVCYDFQLVERCPHGAGDQPVSVVATEDRSICVTEEDTP